MNLANVRSAIGVTIALLLLALAPARAAAEEQRVVLAWLPSDTTVAELAEAGFSPGVMSAGLGTVPPEQTYLDVGQGNRVFDSLYDSPLPELKGDRSLWWLAVVERAESAPADVVPGLLSSTVKAEGASSPFVETSEASLGRLSARPAEHTVIAIARPTGRSDAPLPIGIAGPGFDGNLTSDSTRTDGYVLSTDVAPTILGHLGIETPAEMSGQPIYADGAIDVAAIESLTARMDVISSRRGTVIGLPIAAWLLLTLLVAFASRGALGRPAVRALGLSVVYLPLLLLLGAAVEPGETAEALLVGIGAPALAAATLASLGGYRALAVASAVTVLAHAIDVIAGSPLTSLSLLGPNPGLGVRFYGIGNELEALLAVLVIAGTGVGLTAFASSAARRQWAAAFVAIGLAAAFVFALGRFGADVGAAIVFPLGAAVAAVAIAGRGGRPLALATIAAPLLALALLALGDLLSGANAHLTRSVLDAGGMGELADVAQRRLQLSARSFGRPVLLAFLPLVMGVAVLAYLRRDRLRMWLEPVPAMRAGLAGALAAIAVATLANDSGALMLEIGAAYLLVFTGFAWAESAGNSAKSSTEDEKLHFRAPHV
ncbi:MAG TPA: hypothetical protein VFM51_06290 [Solirubrobacterales bacterium]|nr:hypothetical protein [Solirubrobacterales bacterium]